MSRQEIKEWLYTILIAVVLVIVIRAFVLDTRLVPTTSMVPTIMPGDRLFVEKVSHRLTGLNRGDVVVFEPPPSSALTDDLIKRLIALPGDSVEVKDGQLYINGIPQDEPYIAEKIEYNLEAKEIPPGKLFVLGDNRNGSYDSHEWGFVDIESVEGKALITYWPLDRFKLWWQEPKSTAKIEDFSQENAELQKLLPEQKGFQWVYSGFAEYGHRMELVSLGSTPQGEKAYHLTGQVDDVSAGEAKGDFSLNIDYIIQDGVLIQRKNAEKMLDTFKEIELIRTPLQQGTKWEQTVLDQAGRQYGLVCTITEIKDEEGEKDLYCSLPG